MNNEQDTLLELLMQNSFSKDALNCINNLLGKKDVILYGAGSGYFWASGYYANWLESILMPKG